MTTGQGTPDDTILMYPGLRDARYYSSLQPPSRGQCHAAPASMPRLSGWSGQIGVRYESLMCRECNHHRNRPNYADKDRFSATVSLPRQLEGHGRESMSRTFICLLVSPLHCALTRDRPKRTMKREMTFCCCVVCLRGGMGP